MEYDLGEEAKPMICVALYTPHWIVRGNLRTAVPMRLSDLLNNWDKNFVPVEEARVIDLGDARIEGVSEGELLAVALEDILMAHEIPLPETQSVKTASAEMRVQKQPESVRVWVGPYRAEGAVHLPQLVDVMGYVERITESFLPLTSATIEPPASSHLGKVGVSFVLVNRHRLLLHRLVPKESPEE